MNSQSHIKENQVIKPAFAPDVSMVMCVHNGAEHVKKALESIQRQTYGNFELIIIDDGSTDQTGEILAHQTDPRFLVYTNRTRIGMAKSLNCAISKARGRYIARMNPNDLSHPDRLQVQVNYLDRHHHIALVGSWYYVINDTDRVIGCITMPAGEAEVKNGLIAGNMFGNGSVMFCHDALERVGPYDERLIYSPDYDLWLRISEHYSVTNIEAFLYYRRETENGQSHANERHRSHYSQLARKFAAIRRQKGLLRPTENTVAETVPPIMAPLANVQEIIGDVAETGTFRNDPTMSTCLHDPEKLQVLFDRLMRNNHLSHAKSLLQHLRQKQPGNLHIRKLMIALCLKQNQYQAAMDGIEALVACNTPRTDLIRASLAVRDKIGPRRISEPSSKSPRVSLCMIIKNEQDFLGPCLNAIKSLVDEMVIVDTGSTDKSVDIAKIYGALVYEFEWCNDFSAARNFSLEKAHGDWILILDADEIIAPQDFKAFRNMLPGSGHGSQAFSFQTRNYSNLANTMDWQSNDKRYPQQEAGIGWFPTNKVRLFPRSKSIRFVYPVHELVEPSIKSVGLKITKSPIPIHHYGCINEDKRLRKIKQYFELGYEKLAQMHNDAVSLRELAIQAGQLERWSESIDLWHRFLQVSPDDGEAYANIAGALWQLGEFERGITFSKKAVRISPDIKEGFFNLAVNHMMNGNLDEAIITLRKLLTERPDYAAAQFMLAAAYHLAGNRGQSLDLFEEMAGKIPLDSIPIAVRDLARKCERAGLSGYAERLKALLDEMSASERQRSGATHHIEVCQTGKPSLASALR